MISLLLSFFFLAAPPVSPTPEEAYTAERIERLRRLEGTQVELFGNPQGPNAEGKVEKVWQLKFVTPSTPGGFEAVLTEGWRGTPVPEVPRVAPLTFKLTMEFGPCGSAHLKGTATERPEVSIEIISHKTRMCEDLPANDMLATVQHGKTATKLYQAPDR